MLSPEAAANLPLRRRRRGRGGLEDLGFGATHVALPPAEFVEGRLSTATFAAAVTDIAIGLDPDLYPLLASSQTRTGGSNIGGVQDPALDKLLGPRARPGRRPERASAYPTLQNQLGEGSLPPAAGLPGRGRRAPRRGSADPSSRQVADPADRFWDVLTWRLAADR